MCAIKIAATSSIRRSCAHLHLAAGARTSAPSRPVTTHTLVQKAYFVPRAAPPRHSYYYSVDTPASLLCIDALVLLVDVNLLSHHRLLHCFCFRVSRRELSVVELLPFFTMTKINRRHYCLRVRTHYTLILFNSTHLLYFNSLSTPTE